MPVPDGRRCQIRGAALAARCGAFDAWHGGTVKVIYSEAFRAPTEEEQHLANPLLVLANPDLTPEIVRSVEALVQQRVGSQRVLVGVFRSWWQDVVVRYRLPRPSSRPGSAPVSSIPVPSTFSSSGTQPGLTTMAST